MNARDFRDDDAGYLAWLDTHPDGYVLNIARSHNATEARLCGNAVRPVLAEAR